MLKYVLRYLQLK